MKRLFSLCLILGSLFCFSLVKTDVSAHVMVQGQGGVMFPTHEDIINCGGSTSPTYFRADVQRPLDRTMYKKPRIAVYKSINGQVQVDYYKITDSYWKNRGVAPGKKAIFFGTNGSSGVKLVIDANDFQHPTTGTLVVAGQTVQFSNATQQTSGYYWTQYSFANYTEGFTCPESASLDPTYSQCISAPRF